MHVFSTVNCNETSNSSLISHFKVEDLQRSIEKSGTEKQLNQFFALHEELTSLSLLSNEVSSILISIRYKHIVYTFIFIGALWKYIRFLFPINRHWIRI